MLSLRLSILLFRFSNCYHPWVSQAPFRLCGFSSGDSPSPVSIRFRMLIRYSINLSINRFGFRMLIRYSIYLLSEQVQVRDRGLARGVGALASRSSVQLLASFPHTDGKDARLPTGSTASTCWAGCRSACAAACRPRTSLGAAYSEPAGWKLNSTPRCPLSADRSPAKPDRSEV